MKRKLLSKAEITAIINLLISLCKYYQVGDKHALTLGCHLLPDFFSQAKSQLIQVIEQAKAEGNAEFIMVNFELRSKHFIQMIIEEQRMLQTKPGEVPNQVSDELFASLFTTTYTEMMAEEGEIEGERMIDFTGGRIPV